MAEEAEYLIRQLRDDSLTSEQLYRLGLVLHCVPENSLLAKSCQNLLSILPHELFETLDEAILIIPFEDQQSIIPALQSVLALNKVVKSPPRKAPSVDLIQHLISASSASAPAAVHGPSKAPMAMDLALDYIRLYLLRETDSESLIPILHQLQEDRKLWPQILQKLSRENRDWHETILHNLPIDQRDYLETLLRSNDEDLSSVQSSLIKNAVESVQPSSKKHQSKRVPNKATPEQEMVRRIEQVKAIAPDFGDGFVEAALSQYQGNVEATVSTLLEPAETWPTVLQTMDRHLPRRARKTFDENDAETREIVKARIKAEAAKEEHDAYMLDVAMRHDEYADDYDDQYDDIDGAGNVDFQNDYEAVRTYNRVLRGVEADQSYFEEIRNTNRQRPKQQGRPAAGGSEVDTSDQEAESDSPQRKYRGPDKMKGGRIPGRGGRGGRGRGGRNTAPSSAAAESKTESSEAASGAAGKTKQNLRSKQRRLDKRRDQQKKAQAKRTS